MTPLEAQQLTDTINRRFAVRLGQVRQARGLSRRELGERVGLSHVAIGLAEGVPSRPLRRVDIGEMLALVEVLGVSAADMVRAGELDLDAIEPEVRS